jgi:hypothetical protein
VLDRALRKGENARLFDLFGGEGLAFFPAGGHAAGMVSTLFTVDPLEQDVEQEVAAENAKREEHGNRHRSLTRTGVNRQPGQAKSRSGKAKKS